MSYVNVNIDLGDLSDDDLISELENRYLLDDDQSRLLKLVTNDESKKMNLFLKIKDQYSVLELEEMFKEQAPSTPTPKEQLKLPI